MNFDRIAPHYRWLEALTFGSTLQKARTRWVKSIDAPKRVLIFGDGDGRFLYEFLRAHPNAAVDSIDASARMLELSRERIARELPQAVHRARFLCQDIIAWSPSGSHDLLVANFVLDCFPQEDLRTTIRKLAQVAAPGAYLILTDFSLPQGILGRAHARLWLAVMYWVFRATAGISATELIDPSPELEANGFVRLARSEWRFGLVKSELWQRGQAS